MSERRGVASYLAVDTVKFINHAIRYKPGWSLTAMLSLEDLNCVMLQVMAPVTLDSRTLEPPESRADALSGTYKIVPGPHSYVARQVMHAIKDLEVHESREFFRVNDEIIFDPHTDAGNERFRFVL